MNDQQRLIAIGLALNAVILAGGTAGGVLLKPLADKLLAQEQKPAAAPNTTNLNGGK